MELIPLVDEENEKLFVKGFAERKWAENQGLCHLTTLLIPVFPDRAVQIQVRPPKKSYPGCRDIFGGHVTLDHEFWSLLLGQPFVLPKIVLAAAIREANEELRIRNTTTNYQYVVTQRDLYRVGGIGDFRWDGEGNVERSTLYAIPIRRDCVTCPMDDIDGIFHQVETEVLAFDDLYEKFSTYEQSACTDKKKAKENGYDYNKANWQFADGAARVLSNDEWFLKVRKEIDRLPDSAFEPYKIVGCTA